MRLTESQLRRVVKRIVAETVAETQPPVRKMSRDEFAQQVAAERQSLKGKMAQCSECGDMAPAEVVFSTGGACEACASNPQNY